MQTLFRYCLFAKEHKRDGGNRKKRYARKCERPSAFFKMPIVFVETVALSALLTEHTFPEMLILGLFSCCFCITGQRIRLGQRSRTGTALSRPTHTNFCELRPRVLVSRRFLNMAGVARVQLRGRW